MGREGVSGPEEGGQGEVEVKQMWDEPKMERHGCAEGGEADEGRGSIAERLWQSRGKEAADGDTVTLSK